MVATSHYLQSQSYTNVRLSHATHWLLMTSSFPHLVAPRFRRRALTTNESTRSPLLTEADLTRSCEYRLQFGRIRTNVMTVTIYAPERNLKITIRTNDDP